MISALESLIQVVPIDIEARNHHLNNIKPNLIKGTTFRFRKKTTTRL